MISKLFEYDTEDLILELEARSVACVGAFHIIGEDNDTYLYEATKGNVQLRVGVAEYINASICKEANTEFDEEDEDAEFNR
jgi:hypothetical protein